MASLAGQRMIANTFSVNNLLLHTDITGEKIITVAI
jgi:hypothetical protein